MKFLEKVLDDGRIDSNLLYRAGRDEEIYDVQLSHATVALIDREENIIDIFPATTLRYTIDEAEKLVERLKKQWPDYAEDAYYGQGKAIYPVLSSVKNHNDIEYVRYTSTITLYRYKIAGEWVFGITTKHTSDEPPTRYVEASMDGWEQWLKDHQRILAQAWTARYA